MSSQGGNAPQGHGGFFPFLRTVEILHALEILRPQGHEGGLVEAVELAGYFQEQSFHNVLSGRERASRARRLFPYTLRSPAAQMDSAGMAAFS